MPPGTLIIRADAGVAMGTGHVMRCLALAQAWQDEGGECIFATAETTAACEERIRAEKFECVTVTAPPGTAQDAAQLVELAATRGASWVVVDGYRFGIEYQKTLKAGGLKLLVIDDTGHAGAYAADLVLDQNAHATEKLYQCREPYTRLLLGCRYALLRREFKTWREWKREIAPIGRRALITMGGSDPENLTPRVLQALRFLSSEGEIAVVIGGSNPNLTLVQSAVSKFGGTIRLWRDVSHMPELMTWADIAVSSAGTTCWEMCLLGLPAVLLDLAENQSAIARGLAENGAALHVSPGKPGWEGILAERTRYLLASAPDRTSMSARGRTLVDGAGAERVVPEMLGS